MSDHPVCLGCWRNGVSMTDDPPRRDSDESRVLISVENRTAGVGGIATAASDRRDRPGWPEEHCTICLRRTNQGIYVDDAVLRVAARRVG